MRWQGRRGSSNVEDRRGMGGKIVGGGLGTIVIALVIYFLGGDPTTVLQNAPTSQTQENYVESSEEKELAQFVSVVLAETEDVWHQIFKEQNAQYTEPKLVLFSGQVQSACGVAGASSGPFYCPGDQKVYIDLSFYKELQDQFKAPGDFAMAYVIAHEVGHHVQKLTGVSDQVDQLRRRVSKEEYNKYSVMLELQADFYAGVWAHYTEKMKNLLDEGDIDEALNAASQIGDDRIQKQAQGYTVPETFTHGTSEQRKRWFYKGYRTGDINQGDTFNAKEL
ncbi:MAG TPA: neutral zinc metallopeptidase [Ignavibacteriaceae bacterium]|nr:neutral zinc metallopeptidase [Ignavibacteriaceae bacterium]